MIDPPMQLGDRGKALIQSFESLALVCYLDQGGIPTIGWGHKDFGLAVGTPCTVEQAGEWFLADAAGAVRAVNLAVATAVSQNQFDALVAFTFNVGTGAFRTSTLLRLLNQGDAAAAAQEFVKWDHVNGQMSAGLLRRRMAERDLFLS